MRRFLVAGRTGVGKSSFINAAFGARVAPTAAFEACTKIIEYYTYHTPFGDVCLVDTPGLSEDTLETDRAYLRLIQAAVAHNPVEVLLYITPLNENRLRADEMNALKLLATHLTASLWKNVWVVLTFAASLPLAQVDTAAISRLEPIATFLHETLARTGKCFPGFQKIILIDNIVPNWHQDAVPISSLLIPNG
jgi:predicted GTPase